MASADTPVVESSPRNPLAGIPDAELTAKYKEVRAERENLTGILTTIKDEMARRDGMERAAKKLAGTSPQERDALRRMLEAGVEESLGEEEPTDLE